MADSENKRNKANDVHEEMEINDAVINREALGGRMSKWGEETKDKGECASLCSYKWDTDRMKGYKNK